MKRLHEAMAAALGMPRINIRQWASLCEISRTTMYAYHPSWPVIQKVAKTIGVSTTRLARELAK
jgi:DNA-binding XRE family transcriptional regulator